MNNSISFISPSGPVCHKLSAITGQTMSLVGLLTSDTDMSVQLKLPQLTLTCTNYDDQFTIISAIITLKDN